MGKNETFYVDSNNVATERNKPRESSARGRNPSNENSPSSSDFRCFECEGKGHYASICPTRKQRLESEKKKERKSDRAPETPKEKSRKKWRGNRQLRKPSENS